MYKHKQQTNNDIGILDCILSSVRERKDGVCLVDVKLLLELLHTNKQKLEALIVNDFGWRMQTDFDSTTIYIEPGESIIYAGAYDTSQRSKISRIRFVARQCRTRTTQSTALYILRANEYKKIIKELDK